jgi:hypothetical protein
MLYERKVAKSSFAGPPCPGELAPLGMNTAYLLIMKNKH